VPQGWAELVSHALRSRLVREVRAWGAELNANNTITGLSAPSGYVHGISGLGAAGMMCQYVTISGNFIESTRSAPLIGVRFELFAGNVTITSNMIVGATYGLWMAVGAANTTVNNVQTNGNTFLVANGGVGIVYGQDASVNAFMNHLTFNGNIVGKAAASSTGTVGIWNNGTSPAPTALIVGNDFSGTDTAYNAVTPTVGNLP
jgi:hypothetical protein